MRVISSITLCLLLFVVAKVEIVWFFNGLVALVSGILVYVASFDKGYFLRTGFLLKLTALIGERSYSMYLTHMISFVFVKEIFYRLEIYSRDGLYAIYLAIAAWACILIFSEFSYRFIEQPLRERGREIASAKSDQMDLEAQNVKA